MSAIELVPRTRSRVLTFGQAGSERPEGDAGKRTLARLTNMGQQGSSCWDPVPDAFQKREEPRFPGAAETLDLLERSAERLEWELTRWPEGAEL
jgi:hypothetical protein